MTKFKVVLFCLSLGVAAVSVAGETLFPGMQPFAEGVIEYVDLETGELVLDDTSFPLHDKASVRTSGGGFATLDSLRLGRDVRLYSEPALPTYVKGIELR